MTWATVDAAVRLTCVVTAGITVGAAVAAARNAVAVAHRWLMASLALYAFGILWGMWLNYRRPLTARTFVFLAAGVCGIVGFRLIFSFNGRRVLRRTRNGRDVDYPLEPPRGGDRPE